MLLFLIGAVALALGLSSMNGSGGPRVKTVRPRMTVVEQIVTGTSLGTLEAERDAVVSSEATGKVMVIVHREGKSVKPGDVVVSVDTTELEAEEKVIENEITAAGLQRNQARLRREKLLKDLQDARALVEKKIGRADEVESLEKEVHIAEEEEKVQEAMINRHLAHRELIRLRISRARVMAPFAGTIAKLFIEEGSFLAAGRPVFRIVDDRPPLVRAPIDEVDMAKLATGQPARVEFDALPGKPIPGKVAEILPTVSTEQRNDRTVDVKVRPDALLPGLRVGASAKVSIIVDRTAKPVLAVPTNVIFAEDGGRRKYLFVVEGGVARRRDIVTGLENWEITEVTGGLSDSDRVIVPMESSDDEPLADGRRVTTDDPPQ